MERLRSEVKLRLERQKLNVFASPVSKQRPAWASPTRIEYETDDEKKQRLKDEVRVRLTRKENALFGDDKDGPQEDPRESAIESCDSSSLAEPQPGIAQVTNNTKEEAGNEEHDENMPPQGTPDVQEVHQIRPQKHQAYNTDKEWAFENLVSNYQAQEGIDPDTIFNRKISECDLSKIFERQSISYTKRYSTGDWANDTFTVEELKAYKRDCGYKGKPPSLVESPQSSESPPASPPPPPPPPPLADIRFSE